MLNTTYPSMAELPARPEIPTALKHITKKGEPGLSDLFIDPFTGHAVFSVVVPVKRGGDTVYSIAANVAPHQLAPLVAEQGFPASWRSTIADSAGSIVMRSHDIEKFQGHILSAALMQGMTRASLGSLEGNNLDGTPALTVFSQSPVTR